MRRCSDYSAYADREKTGRGCGLRSSYQPWLKVSDFTQSQGMRCRLFSAKCGRVVHLLSTAEKWAFLSFDWSDDIVEIYEQFPLDPSVTKRIAEELQYRHPGYTTRSGGAVMTTDFVVRRRTGFGFVRNAYQVKSTKRDAENPRTQEKLQIERTYWERQRTEWALLYAEDFNPIFYRNLERLHPYRNQSYEKRDIARMIQFLRDVSRGCSDATADELHEVVLRLPSSMAVDGWEAVLILAAHKKVLFPINKMDVDCCVVQDFQKNHV